MMKGLPDCDPEALSYLQLEFQSGTRNMGMDEFKLVSPNFILELSRIEEVDF
jgi:hypothetical protein